MAEIMVRDLKDGDSGVALGNIPRTTGKLSLLLNMWQRSVQYHHSKGTTSLEYGVGARRRRDVFSLAALVQALGVVQVTLFE